MKPIKLLYSFALIILTCHPVIVRSQTLGLVDTAKAQELRINPRAALSEEVEAEEVFSAVSYIPLETTKRSLFGKIDQLEITDNYFIILDNSVSIVNFKVRSSILIFKKNGDFHARIDGDRFGFFSIYPQSKEIVIQDKYHEFLFYYTLEGKLLRKIRQPFSFSSFVYTPDNQIAYFRNFYFNKENETLLKTSLLQSHNVLLCKPDFDFYKVFLPFDTVPMKYTESQSGLKYFTRSGSETYFHLPYQYEFFSLDNEQLTKRYRLILPSENSLPPNFMTQLFKGKRWAHIQSFPNQVFSISGFYKTGKNLAFYFSTQKKRDSFFYNVEKNVLTSLSAIKTNPISLIVPFKNKIIASDGELMYTWMNAGAFFSDKRNLHNLYNGSSQVLREFLSRGNLGSNPILISLKVI